MSCTKTITCDENLPPVHRFNGVLAMVWGWAWYQRKESVHLTAIALPSAQWQEVCGMLATGVALDPIAGVNLGLS